MKILKKFFLHWIQRFIVLRGSQSLAIFEPWVKSYEACSIFRTFQISVDCNEKVLTYAYQRTQNFMRIPNLSKFWWYAHAIRRYACFTIFLAPICRKDDWNRNYYVQICQCYTSFDWKFHEDSKSVKILAIQ